jgi:hypothetical protein
LPKTEFFIAQKNKLFMPYTIKTKNILFFLMLFLSLFLFKKTQASPIYVNDISSADGVCCSIDTNYAKSIRSSIAPKSNLVSASTINSLVKDSFVKSKICSNYVLTSTILLLTIESTGKPKTNFNPDRTIFKSNLLTSINTKNFGSENNEKTKEKNNFTNSCIEINPLKNRCFKKRFLFQKTFVF